ncbi:MAG: hypothetical protein HY861_03950 [Chlamydiia bacterium]|nr:hypothetical protein [Chlamydiia bacterium]
MAGIFSPRTLKITTTPAVATTALEPPQATPEQVEQQLKDAQAQFDHALTLFNPWYTGPLITPSASMMPPGYGNLQPYLFVKDTYAQFDENRHSVSAPNAVTVNPLAILQFGITDSMDTILTVGGIENWKQEHNGGGFSDITASLGFLIVEQSFYVPKAKFSIQQLFPTGQYKNLNSNGLGLSASGAGAWQTTFSLAFGKLLFWNTTHPMNVRLFFGYTISTPINVKNFNTYGGGFGTDGTVHPGSTFACDLGLEYSINQPWVFALDLVYTATGSTSFTGSPGLLNPADPTLPATVGDSYNDNLSLAPAIEYNWNENLGVLGGVQFSVYGRNSGNFVSGIFSVDWTFPVH